MTYYYSKVKIQFFTSVFLIFLSISTYGFTVSNQQAQENPRFYLSFKQGNQEISQVLVVYHPLATNGYDFGIDAELFGYTGNSLYSMIEGMNSYYVIQARAMPFDETDTVRLGINILTAGNFSLGLGQTQGIFSSENQPVYIKDKVSKVVFNLREGAYNFYSPAGTFNDRFEIVYLEGESIWTGEAWEYGNPHPQKDVLIDASLHINADYLSEFGEAVFRNITVHPNGSVTIYSGYDMTVNGSILNSGAPSAFVVQSDANLIQTQEVNNLGPITVQRNAVIKHLDYTIWSSPVAEQGLQAFSPNTLSNRIYEYNGAPQVNDWQVTSGVFEAGKGYMFRAPNVFDAPYPNAYTWTGTFVGTPYNAALNTMFENIGNFQSVGNPYPSNIDIEAFFEENENVGALYFWTNTNPAVGGSYTGNNWTYINRLGEAVAALAAHPQGNNSEVSNGIISVGQGFLARVYNNYNRVHFNNSMRTQNNAVFFKSLPNQKHTYRLNLSYQNNPVNQILVSYNAAATEGFDLGMDVPLPGEAFAAIYTLIENNEEAYGIQGRALPFNQMDIVPLGFKATEAGSYSISLSNVEGLFAEGQNIYLRDKFTQIEHDLKAANYNFVSEQGTFNERFEVVYTPQALSVTNPTLENSWIVYKNDNTFNILTQGFEMKEVAVYDMLGRIVYRAKDVNSPSHQFRSLDENQVLILKVTSIEGQVLIKKWYTK